MDKLKTQKLCITLYIIEIIMNWPLASKATKVSYKQLE